MTHKQIEIIEQLLSLITSDWWEYGNSLEREEEYKDEWRKKLGYIYKHKKKCLKNLKKEKK